MPSAMNRRRFLLSVIALLALNWFAASALYRGQEPSTIAYSPLFLDQAAAGNVAQISSTGTGAIQGVFRRPVRVPGATGTVKDFQTQVPAFADDQALSAALTRGNVTVNASPPDTGPGILGSLIVGFGPVLLLIGAFVWLSRRATSAMGGGPLSTFTRSRARRVEGEATRTTFADVAGIDDAKEELAEIVDYLRRPERYRRLGGRVPRGVLLSGVPGTGKTLLARAVAGEAGVPYFSMSASEFVEMIVGVGASRVRDLFAEAKAAAPSIIFIDELDAIGRARTAGALGGNDEREQTLNQVLTEMDGFDAGTGVVVLAATNRAEVLDPALLRPGRFDRRIAVQPPDIAGRRQILAVHTRSLPLAGDVDLDAIAAATPGMVGADLANLANEAALLATRRDHDRVEHRDFTDALERVLLGAERKLVLTPADRRRTAYHEAGHALVGMLTPGADPVRKVSIIPRGPALGVTYAAPDTDRVNYDEQALLAKIRVAIAGRAAEELVFGDLTTGAESDIQQLTQVARAMVTRWGMSPQLGPVALPDVEPAGSPAGSSPTVSEATHRAIDAEVRRIVTAARADAVELLRAERARLDRLAAALLEQETLDQEAAYRAAGLGPAGTAPTVPAKAA